MADKEDDPRQRLSPAHSSYKANIGGMKNGAIYSQKSKFEEGQSDTPPRGTIDICPFLMINLANMLLTCQSRIHYPLMTRFVYSFFAKSVLGNSTILTDTISHPCLEPNTSRSIETELRILKIQDLTSQMLLWCDVIIFSLSLISVPCLGAFSTILPRKIQLLIPASGVVFRGLTITSVIYWEIDISWLFAGFIVAGLSGGMNGAYMGCFLYTSDITPHDRKRILGLTVLEGVRGIMGAGMNVLAGYLLQTSGFLTASLVSTLCVIIALAIICFLPNRQPKLADTLDWSFRQAARDLMFPLFSKQEANIIIIVFLNLSAKFLTFADRISMTKVMPLYLMNIPFCWDATSIGWFTFAREMVVYACAMFAVPILLPFLPGLTIGIVGAITNVAAYLTCAFASKTLDMYFVAILSFGEALPVAIVRGETSRLLSSKYQGSVFAKLAMMEILGGLAGTPLILSAYRASLNSFNGLAFVVMANIMICVGGILSVGQVIWRRNRNENATYQNLDSQSK